MVGNAELVIYFSFFGSFFFLFSFVKECVSLEMMVVICCHAVNTKGKSFVKYLVLVEGTSGISSFRI